MPKLTASAPATDESLARTKQELEDTREEGSAWRCQYEALHKKHKIKETNYSCLTVSDTPSFV